MADFTLRVLGHAVVEDPNQSTPITFDMDRVFAGSSYRNCLGKSAEWYAKEFYDMAVADDRTVLTVTVQPKPD